MSDPEKDLEMELDELAASIRIFIIERDTALLSMDMATLLAFGAKHGVPWGYDPSQGYDAEKEYWFWVAVHHARTGARMLPDAAREESRDWLRSRGLQVIE